MSAEGLLSGMVVGVVARAGEWRACEVLEAAGARALKLEVSELVTEHEEVMDALLLVAADEPERFATFSKVLSPALRPRPTLALVDGNLPARRLTGFGAVGILDVGAAPEAIVSRLAALIEDGSAQIALHESEVARSQTLATRLAASNRDVATLSHDVRVLCGIAMGYAANLRDGFAGPLDGTQREHVAQILAALSDVGALLENFSGQTRKEDDLQAPSRRVASRRRILVDVVEQARAIVSMFEGAAAEKSIAVSFRAEAPLRAWCDPTQLKQAVVNLVVNAIKFTPEGGAVMVEVDTTRIADVTPDSRDVGARLRARIVVRDTGPGVPEEDRERIFARGARGSHHGAVPGSGIGLAVVREVALLHGGAVHVEDAPGGGASFVLTLPIDLRRRREGGVIFVDDAAAAHRLAAAMSAAGIQSLASGADDVMRALLDGCAAVVALPRDGFASVVAGLSTGPAGGEP